MLNKELALVIDFKKAPLELQEAAATHYENLKTVSKIENQILNDQARLAEAQSIAEESAKALRKLVNNWEPGV